MSSVNDKLPVGSAKKGSYKKYNYHGVSDHKIPSSTKRYWASKSRAARIKQAGESSIYQPIANERTIIDNNSDSDTSSEGSNNDVIRNVPADERTPDSQNENLTPMIENRSPYYSDEVLIQTLLILATKLHFRLTYTATEGIMQLYNVLGDVTVNKSTKYHWKKVVDDFSTQMTIHHLCPACKYYVGESADDLLHCNRCDEDINVKANVQSNNTFIYMNLAQQLKEMFETTDAHKYLSSERKPKMCKYALESIFDGQLYREKMNDEMISVNFSVDGVPVFDSSNSSIWPILCTINELKSINTRRNVLLCGLWFGQGEPKMNEYLKPFVAESKTLATEGFSFEFEGSSYIKKCRILMCISDSVARPLLRNSRQFNGEYGCGLCLNPGETVTKGKGYARIYPLDEHGKPFGEGLRTHEETMHHATVQDKGVKGPSILCEIPEFDIIRSLDADWMHCVPLGVCRQFARLWFDSVYHGKDFYFAPLIDEVDALLKSFTPDLDISRTPRKITDRAHWKAHEWVTFLLFYSLPILLVLFPRKYVAHWALLVNGVSILLKDSILPSEIENAKKCLIEFIDGVEKLYGKEHISFNVHLLAHLPRSVSNWGPLWTHSAFPYENANQVLLACVKSSNGAALQICDAFRTMAFVERLYNRYSENLNTSQKEHLDKMLGKEERLRPSLIVDDTHLLGSALTYQRLPRDHYLALQRSNVEIDENSKSECYKRAIVNSNIFHSKIYSRSQKKASYYALLHTGEIFEIELFLVTKVDDILVSFAIGRYFEKSRNTLVHGIKLSHLIVLDKRQNNLAAVRTLLLKEKITLIEISSSQILLACLHPNRRELLN